MLVVSFQSEVPHRAGMGESNFTCVTCQVARIRIHPNDCFQVKFPNAEMHREHFKSDWHRYNLKRKVKKIHSLEKSHTS